MSTARRQPVDDPVILPRLGPAETALVMVSLEMRAASTSPQRRCSAMRTRDSPSATRRAPRDVAPWRTSSAVCTI